MRKVKISLLYLSSIISNERSWFLDIWTRTCPSPVLQVFTLDWIVASVFLLFLSFSFWSVDHGVPFKSIYLMWLCVSVSIFSEYIYICASQMWRIPWESEQGIRFPETGVTHCYDPSSVCWKAKQSFLQEN